VAHSRPIDVVRDVPVSLPDIRLARSGVISVTVVDERGQPLQGVSVNLWHKRETATEGVLVPSEIRPELSDDLGQVRLHNLAPGEYYIRAHLPKPLEVRRKEYRGYAPTYFPGSITEHGAQPIVLAAGEEISALFQLNSVAFVRISGRVVGSNSMQVQRPLMRMDGLPVRVESNGGFETMVTPGDHSLDVSLHAGARSEYARGVIAVPPSGLSDVVITTSPTATIRGRLVADSDNVTQSIRPTEVSLSTIALSAQAADLGRVMQQWVDGWTFELTGLTGMQLLRLRTPSEWMLKAVLNNGVDVTDEPLNCDKGVIDLEVRVGRANVLHGTASADRRAIADYVALLFSTDANRWKEHSRFIARAEPNQHGTFQIVGLPDGRYYGIALEGLDEGAEYDSTLLNALRRQAAHVTVGDQMTTAAILPFYSLRR
jgi:hypothetical protein